MCELGKLGKGAKIGGQEGFRVLAPHPDSAWLSEADARIRTADPFITSEVLYQLSYVGGECLV